MVAYNFKKIFVPSIEQLQKLQTIRAHRKRHTRPGELVQLYTGQRTRHCRKIIPDPPCEAINDIVIDVKAPTGREAFGRVAAVAVDGAQLDDWLVDHLALNDGFDPRFIIVKKIIPDARAAVTASYPDRAKLARLQMGHFWHETHGAGTFEGGDRQVEAA